MKTILLIVLIFCTSYLSAHVSHVFSMNDTTYSITFSKNDNNYDFDLFKVSEESNKVNFTLPKLDIVTFKNVFYLNLKKLPGYIVPIAGSAEKDQEEKVISEIFFTVVSNIETIDDLNYAPIAGTLKIAKKINLYTDKRRGFLKKSKSLRLEGILFKIENVQIVFQDGFIQDVVVDGKIIKSTLSNKDPKVIIPEFEDAKLRFTNYYGIGFSSKKNIRNLVDINLYPNQTGSYDKKFSYIKENNNVVNIFEKNEIHIKIGEVIESYGFKNDLYTTDYSPANIKSSIKAEESITLYKDKTYKILEARVFSDFLGFDSNKPNGLVQIEVEKKFNFNTTRYEFGWYKLRTGIGFMEYLKLSGGVTKIEDNNKYLVPDMQDELTTSYLGNELLLNKRYSTPIDILNHQNWNIGISANLALLDMPLIKSQLHLNGGFRFAQTKVQDSIKTLQPDSLIKSEVNEYNLSYWQFYPEIVWHILPETRYGFYASWRPKYLSSLTDGVEYFGPLDPVTGVRRDNISKWVNEYELLGYLYLNEEKQNGKLFVRWRLNSELGYRKNNFSQFQLGYSFYILGRGKQK